MNEINNKKLYQSIKIYPLFYGLTADLVFWIAINTLFLTTVKGLTPAQINSIEALGTGIGIVFQLFLIKIVRKIGNKNSVVFGTLLLFCSILLNIISTKYIGFLFAESFYTIGFVFKHMDNVILIKNLNYLNSEDQYIKIQTKGNMIYSFITLIISLISGFLFNINPYIPIIICLIICFINILLTYFIYEVPIKEKFKKDENKQLRFNVTILLMILLYGLFYAMVCCGQKNSKLFIQLNMQQFLSLDKVAIYISIFIFISRVCRLISNIGFIKIYNKIKSKTLFLLEFLLSFSFFLLLIGNFIGYNMYGIWIMAFGFFIYLLIRDPFDTYMRKTLFEISNEKEHDKIVNYINLSRKIFTLIYGLLISIILIKMNYVIVMSLLLGLSISFIILITKINNMLKQNKQ